MNLGPKTSTVMMAALVLAMVLAGCTGPGAKESPEGNMEKEIPTHPKADEPELPDQVKQTVESSISKDAEVSAYIIEESKENIMDWYSGKLSDQGYTKNATLENSGSTVILWKRGEEGIFISFQAKKGNSHAIVVQADWKDMKHLQQTSTSG
ncbi:MAG: hypothetical protein SVV03_06660 [Candidatus Nanohaloarchaea archaeon]|nr:hypothetical protein [Candidatus Nanohaloarchaea archaeon]